MTEIITSISAAELPKRGQPLAGGTFIERYWLNNQERALVLLGPEFEREGAWGEYGQDVLTHYVDGEANTRAMAEAGSELAKTVLELGAHIAAPLEGQLLMATKHAGLITDLREDRFYWLSAQRSASHAYLVGFEGGWQYGSGKDDGRLVRPVRSVLILH